MRKKKKAVWDTEYINVTFEEGQPAVANTPACGCCMDSVFLYSLSTQQLQDLIDNLEYQLAAVRASLATKTK